MKAAQDFVLFMASMNEYEMTDLEQERFTRIVKANESIFRQQIDGLRGQQLRHLASDIEDMLEKELNK